jgi:hypothetical protein
MKTIEPYIEQIKKQLNHGTYAETMAHIGMHIQAWTAIQKGAGVSETNAIRIAQILSIDPMEIIAISMSLRAKNKEIRDFWLKQAKNAENQRLKSAQAEK